MSNLDKWLTFTPMLGILGLANIIMGVGGIVLNEKADVLWHPGDTPRLWFGPAIQLLSGIALVLYWANKP